MLFEPNPTPFDLRWRMLGTDVTVNPSFWILSALLGWSWFQVGQLPLLLTWILCVFLSILIHEFGHVLMGRLFGSRNQYIVLYSFGGLAIGIRVRQSYQRILVSFAGPAAQFLLLGAVVLVWFFLFRDNEPVEDIPRQGGNSRFLIVLFMLFEINLFWPILNLLPIWPLDGGQIAREFFQMVWREQGVRYSLILSGVLSGVLAVHCLMGERSPLAPYLWMIGGLFMGLFFAMFAISSFQALQFDNSRRPPGKSDRLPWED